MIINSVPQASFVVSFFWCEIIFPKTFLCLVSFSELGIMRIVWCYSGWMINILGFDVNLCRSYLMSSNRSIPVGPTKAPKEGLLMHTICSKALYIRALRYVLVLQYLTSFTWDREIFVWHWRWPFEEKCWKRKTEGTHW